MISATSGAVRVGARRAASMGEMLGVDEEALAYWLSRFPNLKRVTITPATHGFMYTPLYETPMIRALPMGFNQPMPRGWPFVKKTSMSETSPWVASADIEQSEVDAVKSCWRGLLMVLEQLAEEIEVREELVIPELVMDVHGLNAGLNPHMFGQMSPDYAHLETILAQPGFKRLELPIMVGGMAAERWACLTNGFFRGLLAKAKDLEHFRLSGDSGGNAGNRGPHRNQKHRPLSLIFPVGRWKQLRHFGLSRMPVHVDDLLSVSRSLPDGVRSVELSFLRFPDQDGGYRKLLEGMKSAFLWRERLAVDRPTVHIGLPVGEFLYCGGPNPFSSEPVRVEYGVGIMKDDYEPEYERPHAGPDEMVKLGFYPRAEVVKECDGTQ
ncbi:hypothetical protein NLG97_g9027 [Lecanicillium saksenae]|uniref:Uncharacterized protein n=1 Tax=Lecanicillium saksenae TaxID=468837 RepID=A0ACC1QKJ2_9HYPO|nr:hypothetical protein NLG97_g9027 [Lecanicillium saksenae]